MSCLIEPSKENMLRDPDRIFIDSLKKEMIDNPTTLVSPIVGLVRLRSGEKFDGKHPNSYKYETIGGNNSRIALEELSKKYPENLNFQVCLVAVYVGLKEDLILRLAARHNRATDFTHSMKTQDKVWLRWYCTIIAGKSKVHTVKRTFIEAIHSYEEATQKSFKHASTL